MFVQRNKPFALSDVDMALLTECASSILPVYKHCTPVGVRLPQALSIKPFLITPAIR